MAQGLEVDRLTPAIGAAISGVDLTRPIDSATHDAIYGALLDHLVIFFRDQPVTPRNHLDFAGAFGELDRPHPVYPHVDGFESIVKLENGEDKPPDTNVWHTDLTFNADPPFASILVAREVPETGGDTLWSSQYAAYDALPKDMKSWLATLTAVHDLGDFRNNFTVGETDGARLLEGYGRLGNAIHPLVKQHPVTGRSYLYVNDGFTRHIVGQSARESDRLLQYLFDHIKQPEFQVRFRWRKNSIAMWDNRVTMHYAIADYMPAYRCMNRITVVQDRRAAATARVA